MAEKLKNFTFPSESINLWKGVDGEGLFNPQLTFQKSQDLGLSNEITNFRFQVSKENSFTSPKPKYLPHFPVPGWEASPSVKGLQDAFVCKGAVWVGGTGVCAGVGGGGAELK